MPAKTFSAIVIFSFSINVWGDLLPPSAASAAKRLRDNPRAFDRTDQFCARKSPGASCVIPGSTFAGGGAGICENQISTEKGAGGRKDSFIDLRCERTDEVVIDRRLPDGGFVAGQELCHNGKPIVTTELSTPFKPVWNCKPPSEIAVDRFCVGKSTGASCTVELRSRSKLEKHEGVCREKIEHDYFYFRGRQEATRLVILCEPRTPVVHTFTPISPIKKFFQ